MDKKEQQPNERRERGRNENQNSSQTECAFGIWQLSLSLERLTTESFRMRFSVFWWNDHKEVCLPLVSALQGLLFVPSIFPMTSTTTKAMTPLLLQSRRFRRTTIGFQQTRRQLFFVMTLTMMMLLVSVAVAWTLNPPPSSWSRTRASPCGRCCPFDASLQALVWNDFDDTSDHLEPQDEEEDDDEDDDNEEDGHDNPETEPNLHATRRRGRASVVGFSVEQSSGFWAMVQSDSSLAASSTWWALPVTSSAMDRWAATSGPALTLVQLLGQVDMAGMVFPPHRLAQLLICGLEEQLLLQQEQEQQQQVLDPAAPPVSPQARAFVVSIREQIRTILNGASSSQHSTPKEEDDDDDDEYSYTDASNWIRSRVRLPLCTLDQVTLSFVPVSSSLSCESTTATCRCTLDIVLHPDHSVDSETKKPWTLSLPLTELTVQHVLAAGDTTAYNDYEPLVSYHFLAVALALRYKAPIVVVEEEQAQEPPQPKEEKQPETTLPLPAAADDDDTLAWAQTCHGYSSLEALQRDFPHYVTAAHLQQSSQRVVQTIEQGFEWHQLQAAWKIARQKQDYKAMAKIQDKLNQLEQQQQQQQEEGLSVQPESDMDQME